MLVLYGLAATTVCLATTPAAAHEHSGGGPDPVDPLPLSPRGAPGGIGDATWPFYGKDLANSRNGGAGGPSVAEARRLGPVWSYRSASGDYTGTPIVSKGMVVVGSGGGVVTALDARSGRPRWSVDLHDYINGSVAIVAGRVYVPLAETGHPAIAALRQSDGRLLWRTEVDSQPGSDVYGSPVVAFGRVYLGVSALFDEHHSGQSRVRGSMVALNAVTGRLSWKRFVVPSGYDGGAIWSTAAIDVRARRLYVGTSNAYHRPVSPMTDSILALDPVTGRILDHFQATPGDNYTFPENGPGPDYDFGASPNLFRGPDGRLMVGEYQKSRTYWTLDAQTLRLGWKRFTGLRRKLLYYESFASTAYDGSAIYGQVEDGQAWSLTTGGRSRWRTPVNGRRAYSPVAVANGVVYTLSYSAGSLRARSARTGSLLAKLPMGGATSGGVSIAGKTVFAVTGTSFAGSGYVVAFRPRG